MAADVRWPRAGSPRTTALGHGRPRGGASCRARRLPSAGATGRWWTLAGIAVPSVLVLDAADRVALTAARARGRPAARPARACAFCCPPGRRHAALLDALRAHAVAGALPAASRPPWSGPSEREDRGPRVSSEREAEAGTAPLGLAVLDLGREPALAAGCPACGAARRARGPRVPATSAGAGRRPARDPRGGAQRRRPGVAAGRPPRADDHLRPRRRRAG